MVEIREYRPEDCSALRQLMADWGKPISMDDSGLAASAANVLAHPGHAILLAWQDGELAGYAQTQQCHELIFDSYVEVAHLLVAERFRSLGIGRALMERVEHDARLAGFREIKLSSQLQRSRAHVFYENLGYQNFKMSKFYQKRLD